jgi:hypothetical protein
MSLISKLVLSLFNFHPQLKGIEKGKKKKTEKRWRIDVDRNIRKYNLNVLTLPLRQR